MHTEKIIISSIKTLIENPATFRQPFIDKKKFRNDDPTVDEATEFVSMSDTHWKAIHMDPECRYISALVIIIRHVESL